MAEVAVENVVDEYENRYIGRTKKQRETETAVRDSEREYWVQKFQRLGDGRANRTATKEERLAYRRAAAMISQNKE